MKTKFTIAWIVTVIASFFAGGMFMPQQINISNIEENSAEKSATSAVANVTKQTEIGHANISSDIAKKLSEELNKSDDELQDYITLYKLLADVVNMERNDFIDLLEQLAPAENKAFKAVFKIFAKRFPEEAVYYSLTASGEQNAVEWASLYALKRWSTIAPEEAYVWYVDNLKPLESDKNKYYIRHAATALLSKIAEKDVNRAIELLLDNKHNEDVAKSSIREMAQNMEPAEVIGFLDILMPHNNNSLVFPALEHLTKESLEDALYWYRSLHDTNQKKVFREQMYSAWYRYDIVAASDFMYAESSNFENSRNFYRVIFSFSLKDPQLGLDWIKSHPSLNQQQAIALLFSGTAGKDSDFVESNLSLLQDTQQKLRVSKQLVRIYEKISHERAMKFINSSPYREQLLSYYNSNA